jgi:hypothetical protein
MNIKLLGIVIDKKVLHQGKNQPEPWKVGLYMIRLFLLIIVMVMPVMTGTIINEVYAGEVITTASASLSTTQAPQTNIVLLTASQACSCMLRLCKSGEAELKTALAAYPGIPAPDVIDNAKDPDRMRKLTKQYGVYMLPAVLFLDTNGKLKKLYQGDMKSDDLKRAIAQYCGKGN